MGRERREQQRDSIADNKQMLRRFYRSAMRGSEKSRIFLRSCPISAADTKSLNELNFLASHRRAYLRTIFSESASNSNLSLSSFSSQLADQVRLVVGRTRLSEIVVARFGKYSFNSSTA